MKSGVSILVSTVCFLLFSINIVAQQNDTTHQHGSKDKKSAATQEEKRTESDTQMSKGESGGLKSDMQKMHQEMKGTKMTGDPDTDYAHLMIHHHQGAINMSERVLKSAKNDEIKEIAKNVISENKKEIEELKPYAKMDAKSSDNKSENMNDNNRDGNKNYNNKDGNKHDNHKGMMKDMKDMDNGEEMKMSGDIEKDYASMMIMHHKQSIKMSESYLSENKNGKLASLVQKIINDSHRDIQKLEKFTNTKR
jgi:uncharacterized protein (DUF305 family)